MSLNKFSPQTCLLPATFTVEMVKSNFNEMFFARGKKYHEEGRVKLIEFDQIKKNQWNLVSEVEGGEPYAYDVDISIEQKGKRFDIYGDCDCPVEVNCKHVVASLLTLIAQEGKVNKEIDFQGLRRNAQYFRNNYARQSSGIDQWLSEIMQQDRKMPGNENEYKIFYELSQSYYQRKSINIFCQPILYKMLKSGLRSKTKKRYLITEENQVYFTPQDRELVGKLELEHGLMSRVNGSDTTVLSDDTGEALIESILLTGRSYWAESGTELKMGDSRNVSFYWHTLADGTQKFQHDQASSLHIFYIKQLWYLDKSRSEMGRVMANISAEHFKRLSTMPGIPALEAKKVCESLKKNFPDLPLPIVYPVKENPDYTPIPCLHLAEKEFKVTEKSGWSYKSVRMPFADVSFRYGETVVPWEDSKDIIHALDKEGVKQYKRDFSAETAALNHLVKSHKMYPFGLDESVSHEFVNHFSLGQDPMIFTMDVLPKLREAGWQIDIDQEYPYDIMEIAMDEWYANLDEEGSGIEWFNLELGVLLPSGEKINLLPILQRYLLNPPQATATRFITRLEDGRKISLPVQRIQKAASVLIDVFNRTSVPVDQLKLSRLEAMRLSELESALNATKLRWHGGQKLLELAHKLSKINSLEEITLPASFHGNLRPYQQSGLNWLQFLRENQFAGILADDMGLGKTIQAISHITVEKQCGRLQKPVLIIAPTSLMFNWQTELQRFSPDLKVLVLHGAERKQHHGKINHHDVVLTTYPLLARDKDVLLKHEFHMLILDEAQAIKNSRAQAAQIVMQIHAHNRICMTGTPMENHLGELWSLFHFMMPGLLGTEKNFRTVFRYPIEKNQDESRRQLLSRIVSPFLLRRKKSDVVKELPDKVEMTQSIEMETEQRDLYETIRLSMQKKLRETIKKMGLARSHIMILDALLKLRQICCDPRLLKTEKKPANLTSAKLSMLMSMLPELVEEGRKILVFSQFTEMLDLIKKELDAIQLPYVTLTGQTRDRKTPVLEFQSGKVAIFLISLKAGGTGLNLTAADTVIHYDPWWNPAVENQATDRAHRIGQEKKVFVYRLVTKGTIEEKIIELQQRKHALAESMLNNEGKASTAFSMEDLQMLLGEN